LLKIGRHAFDSLAESDQKTLQVGIHSMGVGIGGQEGAVSPFWIFIDGTDILQ